MVGYFNGKKKNRHLKAKARSVFQRRVWFFRDPLWLKKAIAQESHFERVIEKNGKEFFGGRGVVKIPFSSKVQRKIKFSTCDKVITYLKSWLLWNFFPGEAFECSLEIGAYMIFTNCDSRIIFCAQSLGQKWGETHHTLLSPDQMNGTWNRESLKFLPFYRVSFCEGTKQSLVFEGCMYTNTRAPALIKCPHLHVGNSRENAFKGISGVGRKKSVDPEIVSQEEEGLNYRRSPKIMSESHSCSYVTWSWTAGNGSLPLCVYTRIRLPFKHREALYSLPMIYVVETDLSGFLTAHSSAFGFPICPITSKQLKN